MFKRMKLRIILKSFGLRLFSILMVGFSQTHAQEVYFAPLYMFKVLPVRSVCQNAKFVGYAKGKRRNQPPDF